MLNILIGLSFFILLIGCVSPELEEQPTEEPEESQQPNTPECKMVTITEPYVETVCWNVTYTEEVCKIKSLKFLASSVEETHLCTKDGNCVGKPLSDCFHVCEGAMKRCKMNITNLDERYSGVWVVGANFSIDGSGFIKEPQRLEIPAGKTKTFDFTQLYALNTGGNSMKCSLYLLETPKVEDCKLVGREATECEEVTKHRKVEKEICE